MLIITEAAAKQITEQIKQSDVHGMVLRVAAKTNEDGSFDYGMGFDEAKEEDIKSSQYDVDIVMDAHSAELLEDATMDYVELEQGQFHFIFSNPIDPNYIPPKKGK
jgi:iron-sulfur cluster assembly protein